MDFIPHTADEEARMLAAIGVERFDDLIADVPDSLRQTAAPQIADGLPEGRMSAQLSALAAQNTSLTCFRGGGCYDHHIPAVVDSLLSRSEFLTGYTPYQAELSQGMLTTIYEYQSHIQRLTGMEVAAASMYDGASALAEAALMAMRVTQKNRLLISEGVHPHHRQVVASYLSGLEVTVETIPLQAGRTDPGDVTRLVDDTTAAVLLQQPNCLGQIEELSACLEGTAAHADGGPMAVVSANPTALGILVSPGEVGADIVVGEGQPLGVAMSFGGPGVGFFATRMAYVRQMPGRLVGRTVEAGRGTQAREGFCLTFQTREQHIRREKATSNICSNQALLALANTIYLSSLGPAGLTQTARVCHQRTRLLANTLADLPGWSLPFSGPYFHEVVVTPPVPPERVNEHLLEAGFLGGVPLADWFAPLSNSMLFCATENRTEAEIHALAWSLRQLV